MIKHLKIATLLPLIGILLTNVLAQTPQQRMEEESERLARKALGLTTTEELVAEFAAQRDKSLEYEIGGKIALDEAVLRSQCVKPDSAVCLLAKKHSESNRRDIETRRQYILKGFQQQVDALKWRPQITRLPDHKGGYNCWQNGATVSCP